ncbi:hypothetical protein K7432_016978, partial [Basidiobolus ranarum]
MSASKPQIPPQSDNKNATQQMVNQQPTTNVMKKSFAKEMPVEPVTGFYGVTMQSLGEFFGALGSIPGCFCCPNPNKEIVQGTV